MEFVDLFDFCEEAFLHANGDSNLLFVDLGRLFKFGMSRRNTCSLLKN